MFFFYLIEDETIQEKEQRQLERAKIRALSSSMIEELKEEYLDSPLEIAHGSARRAETSKQYKARQEYVEELLRKKKRNMKVFFVFFRYEENYFTRLPVTKTERHKNRRGNTIGTIGDELMQFGDIGALESGGAAPRQKAKKRKLTKFKGKKSKV